MKKKMILVALLFIALVAFASGYVYIQHQAEQQRKADSEQCLRSNNYESALSFCTAD